MKYLIILLFLVLSNLLIGQKRTITARVVETQNSLPIAGAQVEVRNSSVMSTSNFLGYFQIAANVGDTIIISHPSYVFSQVIIPAVEAFQITLEPKYIDLKYLPLDTYPLDNKTKPIIPEFLDTSGYLAKYVSGWEGFYLELGNAIVNHPSFLNFVPEFDYKLQFTITNKGQIQNIKISSEAVDSQIQEKVLKNSLNSLDSWSPAIFNDLPISQHYELSISKGKELFTVVEQAASPTGGYQAFYNYVGQELKYPELARKRGIEGKVYVQFIVEKDGSLTEVEAVKGIGGGCDEEAVRVVQSAPKWSPPMQRGKPVMQRIIMPITFSLGTYKENEPQTFQEYISRGLRYPREGRVMGVEGSMYALFEVAEFSKNIQNIRFFNSLGASFEKEISAALLRVPQKVNEEKFETAKQYILPVSFALGRQKKFPKADNLPEGIKLSEIVVTAIGVDPPPPGTIMKWNPSGGSYESIEEAAERNPKIDKISLVNKDIQAISSEIGKLQQLIFLDLERNNLTELPKEISSLQKLKELYIPSNKLASLPNNFGGLSNLRVLGLASNNLNEFPLQITQLTKLEVLELTSNNIATIPSEIGNLKKLKVLILNDNNIQKLPEEIFTLTKLEKLYLAGTNISPQEIERIKKHFSKAEIRFE